LQGSDTTSVLSNVSASGVTQRNAGTYVNTVTTGTETNYIVTGVNGTFNINQANATVIANSGNLTYNGGLQSVNGFTATGLLNGETIAVLTNVSASGSGTNAGTYVTQATGTATNYNLSFVNGSLNIAKANATVTANSSNVTYNGLVQGVNGYTVTGLQGSDTVANLTSVSVSAGSARNAGVYTNSVTVGNETNYNLIGVAGTLTINKANATITANSANLTYNGSLQAVNGFSASGLVNGETIAVLTNVSATGSGTNAGTYITQATGTATNYNLTFVNGSLVINKAALTVTGNSGNVTYNAANQSIGGYSVTGLQGADTVSVLTNVSSSGVTQRNAGTYVNAVTGGTETNYVVTTVNGTYTIAPKAISITGITASNKTYDGTTSATVDASGASGWIAGDSVVVSSTGSFADKNAGTGKAVLLSSTYSGADASNYIITSQSTATADIAKATLTAVGNKVYDGLITINGSQLAVGGVNGEVFTATGSATMTSKNVQTNQSLSSTAGLTLSGVNGSSVSNYEVLAAANTSITVTPLSVTLIAPNATKVYDGTTLETPTTTDLNTLSAQLVGGDRVSSAIITFSNQNAGANKTVTLNSVVISDDNGGHNYQTGVVDSHGGVINKANLTVAVINDGKIVTQSDAVSVNGSVGYGGVVYSGFVGSETAQSLMGGNSTPSLTAGTITRTLNPSINNEAAGTYVGVLTASGWTATNYNINYQAGNYIIAPADTLLVKVAPNTSVVYGATPTYSLTAQYMHNGTVVNAVGAAFNGSASIVDGVGGSAVFNLNAVNGSYSSSNNLQAGGYNLDAANVTIIGGNFNSLQVIGAVTVTPKTLNNSMGIVQSISKVYDGSTSITGANLSFNQTLAGVIGGDMLTLIGSGSYSDRNVGMNKSVNLSMALTGADANNYALTTTSLSGNIGTITQLSNVTYTGAAGGNWSLATNWAGGALPDANNVARVIIPTNTSVVYDSAAVGVTGSTISNGGNIIFSSASPFNLTNTISGAGTITQRGAGNLTISGNNTMTGVVDIGAYNLTLANSNALGTATLASSGGNLSVASNVVLPNLNTSGNITLATAVNVSNAFTANGYVNALNNINVGGNLTANDGLSVVGLVTVGGNLMSTGTTSFANNVTVTGNLSITGTSALAGFVNTVGDQTYDGALTFTSSGTPQNLSGANFYSSMGNISYMGTVSAGLGSNSAERNLVVAAPNGTVLFNDQVGQSVILARGSSIETILFANYNHADINPYALDVTAQKIKLFGDITTFQSQKYTGSVLIGDNGANGNIRLLLSMDPSITVDGPINDVTLGQHTLLLRALSLPNTNEVPIITYGNVGLTTALAALDVLVGQQDTDLAAIPHVADIAPIRLGVVNQTGQVNTVAINQALMSGNSSQSSSVAQAGKNTDFQSPHGMLLDRNSQSNSNAKASDLDASMGAGEVVVGDLGVAPCNLKENEKCRID
jgi:hypothetical protein